MNFIIKSCRIENFKGIENLEFNFNDGLTQIIGDNETGKTTLFDSFVWCLFGKDSSGNATFGITPNFLSVPKSSVVEYEFEVDGKPVTYKRSYTAKFNRDKTFKEYKTECFINGIEKGVRDFSLEIGKIVDENVFKLLTNPLYFTEQMIVSKGETVSQRQRKYLYEMAGIKSDIDSAKRLKKYSSIIEPLERYGSASEYRRFLKSKINEAKRNSEDFIVKIEQQSENFIDIDSNEKVIKSEIEKLEKEIESLKEEESKVKDHNSNENIEPICPTCKRPYNGKTFENLISKKQNERLNTIQKNIKWATEKLNKIKDKTILIDYNKRCEEKISVLIEEQKKTNKEIERLQKEYDLVTNFIQFKMKSATEKINSLFESVKWELFRVNGEGNTEEICVPYVNGTQYKDLSASAKIFCGIDIIKTFQKQYNMSMPVFIDNKERITSEIPIDGQIITLTAKEECCPKCGGNTGRKQENRKWKCEGCGFEFEKSLQVV